MWGSNFNIESFLKKIELWGLFLENVVREWEWDEMRVKEWVKDSERDERLK